MSKLRRLSGADVLRIFSAFGFEAVAQRGSHIKIRRVLTDGSRQTLVVPDHGEIDIGTLRAIYRQASRYVTEGELRAEFYSD